MSRYIKHLAWLIAGILLVSTAVMPAPTSAQISNDQKRVFRNHVLYFNYDIDNGNAGCGGAVPGAPAGGAIDPSVESDNVRIAYEYFVSKGLAPFRSAAIVGNFQIEAPGLDPAINQAGGGPGRGIAQWSVNGRWLELLNYAETQGRNPYDLVLQLDFAWYEMNSSPPWNQSLPAVQGATTIQDATRLFMELYEKPGVPHLDRRIAAAERVLQLYGNGAPSSGPAAAGGTAAPTTGGPAAGAGQDCEQPGGFTGAPGQTEPLGEGFTLADNTDYSGTPCAAGSTETQLYTHPTRGFRIRICVVLGTAIDVASIVSERVVAMVNAANGAGVRLDGGGFRTYEEQIAARRANGCIVPGGPGNAGCSPPTAVPGNSQHERGLAIDFSSGGTIRRGSPQFNWLSANAAQYGFYNLPSESWHWSTSGN